MVTEDGRAWNRQTSYGFRGEVGIFQTEHRSGVAQSCGCIKCHCIVHIITVNPRYINAASEAVLKGSNKYVTKSRLLVNKVLSQETINN